MVAALAGLGLAWALSVGVAAAQAPGAEADPDAGAVVVRTTVERPPEGSMRRGAWAVPTWVVWAGAAVLIAGAVAGLGYRIGRRR